MLTLGACTGVDPSCGVQCLNLCPSILTRFHADLHSTDLAHLSLGKVSSLLEIEWIQQARLVCPSLRYYYLGFYLHTCHRMRYKVLAPTG